MNTNTKTKLSMTLVTLFAAVGVAHAEPCPADLNAVCNAAKQLNQDIVVQVNPTSNIRFEQQERGNAITVNDRGEMAGFYGMTGDLVADAVKHTNFKQFKSHKREAVYVMVAKTGEVTVSK